MVAASVAKADYQKMDQYNAELLRTPGPDLEVSRLPEAQMSGAPPIIPLAELERRAIRQAIHCTKGNVPAAARLLGIGRTTLYRKIKKVRESAERCPICAAVVNGANLTAAAAAGAAERTAERVGSFIDRSGEEA